jgi:hypothetical protein
MQYTEKLKNAYRICVENINEQVNLGDLGVNDGLILKWVLKIKDVRVYRVV